MSRFTLEFLCNSMYSKSVTSSVFGILQIVLYNLFKLILKVSDALAGGTLSVREKIIYNTYITISTSIVTETCYVHLPCL